MRNVPIKQSWRRCLRPDRFAALAAASLSKLLDSDHVAGSVAGMINGDHRHQESYGSIQTLALQATAFAP